MQGFCQKTCKTCPAARSSAPLPSNAVLSHLQRIQRQPFLTLQWHTLGAGCVDVNVPGSPYSCAQQQGWGKCNASWMLSGNYCALTCGRCAPAPSPPPPPPPPPPPKPKPHPKPHAKLHAKPHPKPHRKPTAPGTTFCLLPTAACIECVHAEVVLLCCSVRGCGAAAWPILMRSTEGLGQVRRILDGWLLPRNLWEMQELHSCTGLGVCPDSIHPGGTNCR